ncbi:butyrophilin subfamily 3 member A1-like [Macrochelys suwanniensis]
MATRWQLCVCSLGILLLAPCSLSEKFSLDGSPSPVMGVVGQDVVLPCQLSPPARLPSMDVLWRKIGTGFIPVHEYSDDGSQDLPGESYQNRTELFPQEFSSGNVSLKLKWLQEADAGTYHCFVRNPEWSQEATTELGIAAVAPVFIDVLGPWGQGIGLACRSAGWFPEPELQWVGKNGQNLTMEIVTNVTQDRENLYSVVSHVTVTEGEDNGDISCIVWNGLLETKRQSAIHLSGDFFRRVSPWLAAFWVLFALVLIAAGTCAYRGYTAKLKASKKKPSKEEPLLNIESQKLREKLETAEKENQALKSETKKNEKRLKSGDWRIASKHCQKLHEKLECQELRKKIECQDLPQKNEPEKNTKSLKPECKELREKLDDITLNADTAHPNISIAEDKKSVKHEAQPQQVPPNPERFDSTVCVLGSEGFSSGKHYWEVDVGSSTDWDLGVARKSIERKGKLTLSPKEGFWALGLSGRDYWGKTDPGTRVIVQKKPKKIGVYISYEEGQVTFFNVTEKSVLFTFNDCSFSGEVYPFFKNSHKETSMKIC